MQPIVPGYRIAGELSSSATGSTWSAVRNLDDRPFAVKVVLASDVTEARTLAAQQSVLLGGVENEHLVRRHEVITLADGTLALVQDEVTGGSLAQLLGARGQLTPGETVTVLAPLLGALADLHAAGVVHGDLAPGIVLFSADGRPLISDLGVARLLGRDTGLLGGSSGFVAPETVRGAAPSPASDVYAMAALGWFCLAGAPPAPSATRPSLAELAPQTPARLVEILTSCLTTDPVTRPVAGAAAVAIFDAAPAEPVALVALSDPAAEITRRIRVAAASASALAPLPVRRRYRQPLVVGVAAALVTVLLGGAATWFLQRSPLAANLAAVQSSPVARATTEPVKAPTEPVKAPTTPVKAPTTPVKALTSPVNALQTNSPVVPTAQPRSLPDVMTAPDSPRTASAGLLQALVDSRALAYRARNSALLDLVYAPGASSAGVDRDNIATAIRNRATYLGLSFVVRDATFLDGTSDTARIRATVVTPAYQTGQPDGRKVSHPSDAVWSSVFALRLTPDGWRVVGMTAR